MTKLSSLKKLICEELSKTNQDFSVAQLIEIFEDLEEFEKKAEAPCTDITILTAIRIIGRLIREESRDGATNLLLRIIECCMIAGAEKRSLEGLLVDFLKDRLVQEETGQCHCLPYVSHKAAAKMKYQVVPCKRNPREKREYRWFEVNGVRVWQNWKGHPDEWQREDVDEVFVSRPSNKEPTDQAEG